MDLFSRRLRHASRNRHRDQARPDQLVRSRRDGVDWINAVHPLLTALAALLGSLVTLLVELFRN
jgi:hypothetical protein